MPHDRGELYRSGAALIFVLAVWFGVWVALP